MLPKVEVLRISQQLLRSDKLLHDDVLRPHELLCAELLCAELLRSGAKLLRSGGERHYGSGSPGGPGPGSGPLRLTAAM